MLLNIHHVNVFRILCTVCIPFVVGHSTRALTLALDTDAAEMYFSTISSVTTPEFYKGLILPSQDVIDRVPHITYNDDQNFRVRPIDYTEFMLPVKNQQKCGSCYAFASVAAIEAQVNIASLKLGYTPSYTPLSVSEIVDCSQQFGDSGCSGGWPAAVFEYVKEYGLCPAYTYSYLPIDEACMYNACREHQRQYITSYGMINAPSHAGMAVALSIHGPLVVGIDATNLHAYKKGVYRNCTQDKLDLNHAVVLVGLVQKDDAWVFKIQNSWGVDFGDEGFFYVGFNSDVDCGISQSIAFIHI